MNRDWAAAAVHVDIRKSFALNPANETISPATPVKNTDNGKRENADGLQPRDALNSLMRHLDQLIPIPEVPNYIGSQLWQPESRRSSEKSKVDDIPEEFAKRFKARLDDSARRENPSEIIGGDGPFVCKEAILDLVSAVSKLLPSFMMENDLDEEEAVEKLRPLLRIPFVDSRIFEMHADVYEVYNNLHSAYLWAHTGFALVRSVVLDRRQQRLVHELVSQEIKRLPVHALHRALQPNDNLIDNPSSTAKPPIVIEPVPPFRNLARRTIMPGSVILLDEPLALAPIILGNRQSDEQNVDQDQWCMHCGRERNYARALIPCCVMPASCPFPFCSMDCFLQNSRRHQYSCQFMHTQLFPLSHHTGFTPAFILLVIRLLLNTYIHRVIDEVDIDIIDDLKIICSDLPSVYLDYKCYRPELWSCIQSLCRSIYHFFPICVKLGLSKQDLDDVISRVHAHSFIVESIGVDFATSPLLILAPKCSRMQHSCIPNMYIAYDPDNHTRASSKQRKSLVGRATAFIKAGEPIACSYISELYTPVNKRKGLLVSSRILECLCARCRDPSEGLRFVDGLRCPKCVMGFVCPLRMPRVDVCIKRAPKTETLGHCGIHSRWECSRCGVLPSTETDEFITLSSSWTEQLNDLRVLSRNSVVQARVELLELVQQLTERAHPNHHVTFEAKVLLVGLLSTNPAKNKDEALHFLLQAINSAFAVLPFADLHHTILGISLIKMSNPMSVRPEYLYRALWSAYCCLGLNHPLTLHVHAMMTNVCAASRTALPANRPVDIANVELLRRLYSNLWPSMGAPSAEDLEVLVKVDPTYLWFAAVRSGHLETVRHHVETEDAVSYNLYNVDDDKSVPGSNQNVWVSAVDSKSGHNSLGLTIVHKQIRLFDYLIKRVGLSELMYTNPWFLNYAHLIASAKPLIRPSGALLKEWDRASVLMMRTFVRVLGDRMKTDSMATPQTKIKDEVLLAKSHNILGCQTPLHYAAQRGKIMLLRELLEYTRSDQLLVLTPSESHQLDPSFAQNASVTQVDILNLEAATPLHLAASEGHTSVCRLLVSEGANVNAPTARGETPLMLACHALVPDCVKYFVEETSADIFSTSKATGITCLHAIVAGVTRTFQMIYAKASKLRGADAVEIQLSGFNQHSMRTIYEVDNMHVLCNVPSQPRIVNQSNDLVRFPDELNRRVAIALDLVSYMRSRIHTISYGATAANEALFAQSCSDGFTPAELLLHQWDELVDLYDRAGGDDTRVQALSAEQKEAYGQDFIHQLSVAIYQLTNLLKPMLDEEPVSLDLYRLTRDGIRSGESHQDAEILRRESQENALQAVIERNQYAEEKRAIRTMQDELDEATVQIQRDVLKNEDAKRSKQPEPDAQPVAAPQPSIKATPPA